HEDVAHNAAVGVLHLLGKALDHQRAAGNDGALDVGHGRPQREPAEQADHPQQPHEGMPLQARQVELRPARRCFGRHVAGFRMGWTLSPVICLRTSFLGPNTTCRPPFMNSSLSTAMTALGRWATTITMPPRWRTARIESVSAASPSASRLALGSSSTTRNGLP